MKNSKRYDYYEVKEIFQKGFGVFAKRRFQPGETVVIGRIVRSVPQRTKYSFQVDWNHHVDLDEPARLLNHSCDPNCGVKKNVFGGYDFIAIKAIKPGDEICWDYSMTEYISIAVKHCHCGSRSCRKRIKGWRYLPTLLKQQYRDFAAPYLLYHL